MSPVEDDQRRALVEQRLREFHGAGLSDVMEVIGYLRGEADTVFAGGSLTFGLGNRLSDFDVVICGPAPLRSNMPLQHWSGTLRIDVWVRSHDDVAQLFAYAQDALDAPGPLADSLGSVEEEQQLKLLHRVAFGLHLEGPPLPGMAGGPTGHGYAGVARDLITREYAERLRESAYVAQLAASGGNWLAASLSAREALEQALQVLLASRGVPFTGDKWLHERLASMAPDLREAYRPHAALPADGAECADYVAAVIESCQRFTGLELGQAELARCVRWLPTGLQVCQAGGRHLLVAPEVGGLWELSAAEAGAWDRLSQGDGAALGWPGGDCGPQEAEFCLGLYERGLLALTWDRGVPVMDLAIPQGVTTSMEAV
jgi:hypothetical protein